MEEKKERSDFDSAWKSVVDGFFQQLMEFLLPDVASEIDWSKGYELLEKELIKIQKSAHVGKRVADKLIKVYKKNGDETWVICHLELQSEKEYSKEDDFPTRMWTYHYKIYDKYKKPLMSLAILTDTNKSWRPNVYEHALWGCRLTLSFPIIKLIDFQDKVDILAESSNPFTKIILAHLDALRVYGTVELKRAQKEKLAKAFYDLKYTLNDLRLFYAFLEYTLALPAEEEKIFVSNMKEYEKEAKVNIPMTSFERFAREEGREEGREAGELKAAKIIMEARFGAIPQAFLAKLEQANTDNLERIIREIATADRPEDINF